MENFLPNENLHKENEDESIDYFGERVLLNTIQMDIECIVLSYNRDTRIIRAYDDKNFYTIKVHAPTRTLISISHDKESFIEYKNKQQMLRYHK